MNDSRLHAWKAAGMFLAVFPAFAAPPLGCVESASGARWCESYKVKLSSYLVTSEAVVLSASDPHPATIVKPRRMYQPMGAQVAPLADVQFLPHFFVPRRIPVEEKTLASIQEKSQ